MEFFGSVMNKKEKQSEGNETMRQKPDMYQAMKHGEDTYSALQPTLKAACLAQVTAQGGRSPCACDVWTNKNENPSETKNSPETVESIVQSEEGRFFGCTSS
jgi:hypothetical protein